MTFTTPPDGSIIFTAAQLADHDRQVREGVIREVQDIVDDCVPRGQYERFDDRLLHRRLRDLTSNGAEPDRIALYHPNGTLKTDDELRSEFTRISSHLEKADG